jgi:hypothetical protein
MIDDMYAWCFGHGRMHVFEGAQKWCTSNWVEIEADSLAHAEDVKRVRYGNARFIHELALEEQVQIQEARDARDEAAA